MSKLKIMKNEQYITNAQGEVEYVVLPLDKYSKLIEIIEDYGLVNAMKEAEKDKTYSKEEALKILENNG